MQQRTCCGSPDYTTVIHELASRSGLSKTKEINEKTRRIKVEKLNNERLKLDEKRDMSGK